jgi:hypothetical protein
VLIVLVLVIKQREASEVGLEVAVRLGLLMLTTLGCLVKHLDHVSLQDPQLLLLPALLEVSVSQLLDELGSLELIRPNIHRPLLFIVFFLVLPSGLVLGLALALAVFIIYVEHMLEP